MCCRQGSGHHAINGRLVARRRSILCDWGPLLVWFFGKMLALIRPVSLGCVWDNARGCGGTKTHDSMEIYVAHGPSLISLPPE